VDSAQEVHEWQYALHEVEVDAQHDHDAVIKEETDEVVQLLVLFRGVFIGIDHRDVVVGRCSQSREEGQPKEYVVVSPAVYGKGEGDADEADSLHDSHGKIHGLASVDVTKRGDKDTAEQETEHHARSKHRRLEAVIVLAEHVWLNLSHKVRNGVIGFSVDPVPVFVRSPTSFVMRADCPGNIPIRIRGCALQNWLQGDEREGVHEQVDDEANDQQLCTDDLLEAGIASTAATCTHDTVFNKCCVVHPIKISN